MPDADYTLYYVTGPVPEGVDFFESLEKACQGGEESRRLFISIIYIHLIIHVNYHSHRRSNYGTNTRKDSFHAGVPDNSTKSKGNHR